MLDEVGTNYTGCQTMSKTGRTCQPWSSQTPHSHSANESMYPGFDLGDHNYCRNPDHPRFLGSAPWCYTTDPETRWEYCEPRADGCVKACDETLLDESGTNYTGCQTRLAASRRTP